ncbi:MAG: 50S ribosomal protein L4 [Verrucomicrobiota bacterium]|nr:50S ribosomal protein L4 [Verrucomicrobiota bacterium]
MKLTVKDINGKSSGELEVKFEMIEDGRGTQAVHDVVTAYRAAQRSGTACAKTVGEVAGSNKKPWKQKGTGRARAGSVRSPLWRGGGVVFGPRPRDFSKKVNGTTKQLALRKALSERLKAGDVTVVDDFKLAGKKTKDFVSALLALETNGTALVVSENLEENLLRASGNLKYVEVTTGDTLNTYQVLRSDKLIFTRGAFEKVEQRLSKDNS